MSDNRESLLTTLRSRRKLYLWLYFIQIAVWLTVVVIYEVSYAERASAIKHAIDIAVTMSFISPGVFVSTIFLVDVVMDGVTELAKKGWELMGLLFTPRKVKNIWQERGEKKGVKIGEKIGIKLGEKIGIKLGEEIGIKLGEEIGIKLGEAQAKAEAADWYARMKQAEKDGEDFNEPPPFIERNNAN